MKIVTAEQMGKIDRACIAGGTPAAVLMENAGRAVAEHIRETAGDVAGKRIVILAGPGNNGGDGLVAARYLYGWNADVSLFLFGKRREDDENLELIRERNISLTEVTGREELELLVQAGKSADILVDALFGTGNNRPLEGIYREALEKIGSILRAGKRLFVVAVDLPSGMNADTGAADDACLHADETVTLAAPKKGLYHFPGSEHAGRITIADIGIPERFFDDITLELNTTERVRKLLPRRPVTANKGTFGKVMVVAGSANYIGAAYLACSGAVRAGAGLVTCASPASLQPILASKMAEVTYLPLPEAAWGIVSTEASRTIVSELSAYTVLLIGCGLGQSDSARDFVRTLLLMNGRSLPVTVIDADALNTLADVPEWWRQMSGNAILTPHPGEMARLTGLTVAEVQRNRLELAGESAEKWGCTVVLKGAYSVIASPGREPVINPAANPGMASAGSGDVLAGVIAGLAAQGIGAFDAATCGMYLHAEAGEIVREEIGDTGMTASDLLPLLPAAIKKVRTGF